MCISIPNSFTHRECNPGTPVHENPTNPLIFTPVNPGLCAFKSPGLTGLVSGVSTARRARRACRNLLYWDSGSPTFKFQLPSQRQLVRKITPETPTSPVKQICTPSRSHSPTAPAHSMLSQRHDTGLPPDQS